MSLHNTYLGLETATHACSVCLYHNGTFFSRETVEPRKHSDLIIPMIQDVLSDAGIQIQQLEGIAVGVGPGSFTGVRVAVGLAKSISYGLNIPIWPISTLRALAHQIYRKKKTSEDTPILVAWDARMSQIYWGLYIKTSQGTKALIPDNLSKPNELELNVSNSNLYVVGSGLEQYPNQLLASLDQYQIITNQETYPCATDIIECSLDDSSNGLESAKLFELIPEYVRNQVAKPSICR